MTNKLYKVFLRGSISGPYYVVATHTTEAIDKVLNDIESKNYGFFKDRILDKIELIAEDSEYPSCDRLYIVK